MDQSKKRILIIEDDDLQSDALIPRLEKNGFVVLKSKNGEEGLGMSLSLHPDLVLLDILLPKMNGMEVLEKLRADEWGKTVPVIMLTNLPSDDEVRSRDITRLEPTYYFVKVDISIEQIIEKIEERLSIN